MIPLEHPFIQKMMEHRNDLANLGNTVRISVEATDGDIFSKEYMETLRQINDEVFYISGVDRSGLKSLWSPSVRWTEVTEEGFAGGEVIPQSYNGSQQSLDLLRNNVLKSGQVGRLVSNDFKSSIVDIPLLESYPDPRTRASCWPWTTASSPTSWKTRSATSLKNRTPTCKSTSSVSPRKSAT